MPRAFSLLLRPTLLTVATLLLPGIPVLEAELVLSCDFSDPQTRGRSMQHHWHVSNRISPIRGFSMPVGERPLINIVRPLGGKAVNGRKIFEEDTYLWNGRTYVYDWDPLKTQIDKVSARARVFQLTIDNPPWAFQRGLDLGDGKEVETYGNAWPPNDPEAWSRYVSEMLRELVEIYGRETVAGWRYCIGREIGTPGHWRGTKEEFFEHYRNTAQAIRSVLPEARIGSHFLWASSKNSMGPEFVRWCRKWKVPYDFVGVSFYPFHTRKDRVDLDHVYEADFAPIKDIPEWNPDATLELHEFALITRLNKAGNRFENAPKAHQESFTVMLAKMMYEHGMQHVFRWGSGRGNIAESELLKMEGDYYHASTRTGEPEVPGNMIDALFSTNENATRFSIMAANYNAKPAPRQTERVQVRATLPVPPDTTFEIRTAVYQDERFTWTEWRSHKTTRAKGGSGSDLELALELPSFSFGKIEIELPPGSPGLREPTKTIRLLTDRKTGATLRAELISVDEGSLRCRANGRHFVIPLDELSEEDITFLEKWASRNEPSYGPSIRR